MKKTNNAKIDFFKERMHFFALFLLLAPFLVSTNILAEQSNDQNSEMSFVSDNNDLDTTRGCGKCCVGPRGPRGATGAQGATGATGAAGGSTGFTTMVEQVFTIGGGLTQTYTPTPGMKYAVIEVIGGGGGSGGSVGIDDAASPGGGSGGYSRSVVSAATIGVSQTVTIGTGGAGGAVGANPGGNGTDSSVGAIVIAHGGDGSPFGTTTAQAGGAGAVVGTGDFVIPGGPGGNSNPVGTTGNSGVGASSVYGAGGAATPITLAVGPSIGNPGQNYGSGAGGSTASIAGTAVGGASGANGVVIITEFI